MIGTQSKAYMAGRARAWEDTRFLFDDSLTLEQVSKFVDDKYAWIEQSLIDAEGNPDAEEYLDGYEDCLKERTRSIAANVLRVVLGPSHLNKKRVPSNG